MKNKRVVACITVSVIIVMVLINALLRDYKSDNRPSIALVLPLTGPLSQVGCDIKDGFIIGVGSNNWELIFEDGKNTAKDSVNAFHKVLGQHPDVVVVAGDIPNAAIASEAKRLSVRVLSTAASGSSFIRNGCAIRCWYSITEVSQMAARYALEKLSAKNFSILYIDTENGNEGMNAFRSVITKNGAKLFTAEAYQVTQYDVKDLVAKAVSPSPDAIFVTGFGIGYVSVMNELKRVKYMGKIICDMCIFDPNYRSSIADLTGIYFINSDTLKKHERGRKFEKGFIARKNKEPPMYSIFGNIASCCVEKMLKGELGFTIKDSPIGLIRVDDGGEMHFNNNIYQFKGNDIISEVGGGL